VIEIKKIEYKDFRSLEGKGMFDFSKFQTGLHQVVGGNGAGKSNLFVELLYWIFFGKTTRGLKGANIHTWNKKGSTKGTCFFEFDNKSYEIERGWNPNYLKINNETSAQEDIEKIIKRNSETIQHTILLAQFTNMFFDLPRIVGPLLQVFIDDPIGG